MLSVIRCMVVVLFFSPFVFSGEPNRIIFSSDSVFDVPASEKVAFSDYKSKWALLTGYKLSGLHWRQFVLVYTNLGSNTYKENFLQYNRWMDDPDDFEADPIYKDYPVNTILLKENYQAKDGMPGVPLTVTAMTKREPGFDPKGGDWEYIQYDVNGKILVKGSSQNLAVQLACAGCHQNVEDRDFIFSSIYSESVSLNNHQ